MELTLEELIALFIDTIINKKRHKDYDRTVKLSKLYNQLITGNDVSELLKQFKPREDAEQFKQRVALTETITPAICASVMKPFYKVPRTDRVVKKVEALSDKESTAVEEINDRLEKYYGSEANSVGLDYFLQSRFIGLSFTDPNAFIITEFLEFDNVTEKAFPYPWEISSESAINYSIVNNELKWLIVREEIVINNGNAKTDKPDKGEKFTLYAENVAIVFREVGKKYQVQEGEVVQKLGDKYYVGSEFAHNVGICPATRVGYRRDLETDERTFINPFHEALCFLRGSIKSVSEFDLSKALHAFPQKLQYVGKCSGESNVSPCRGGLTNSGTTCSACKGSGFKMHSSAQDAIILPMPEHKDEFMNLDQMLVYKAPPIELLEFQNKIVRQTSEDVHQTVFNSTVLVTKTQVATATEKTQDMDSVYDTLAPFAEKFSAVWLAIVDQISRITDNAGKVKLTHRFPSDFKMKSKQDLYSELKTVNDSYAPTFVIEQINDDLADVVFVDNPDGLLRYFVKKNLFPFRGKDETEIAVILATSFTPLWKKVLYTNFEDVLYQAETENDQFYLMEFPKQLEIVKKIVDVLIAELEAEKPAPVFKTVGKPEEEEVE